LILSSQTTRTGEWILCPRACILFPFFASLSIVTTQLIRLCCLSLPSSLQCHQFEQEVTIFIIYSLGPLFFFFFFFQFSSSTKPFFFLFFFLMNTIKILIQAHRYCSNYEIIYIKQATPMIESGLGQLISRPIRLVFLCRVLGEYCLLCSFKDVGELGSWRDDRSSSAYDHANNPSMFMIRFSSKRRDHSIVLAPLIEII